MAYEDLSGKQFQMLEVIEQSDDFVSSNGRRERMWRCKCLLCGDEIVTRERNLKTGHIKSCGRKHRTLNEDFTGRQFNDLTVIERANNKRGPDGTSYVMWKCVCKCGNTSVVRGTSLKNGSVRSCGCSRKESAMGIGLIDITGQEFGYWKVLEKGRTLIEPRGRKVTLWKCQCKCGEIRELRAGTLKSGNSLSCGCYKYETLKAKSKEPIASKAEKIVSQYLSENSIYYEPQKIYKDLRGKLGYPLSYDFLIYDEAMSPILLVECQGKQHYEPIEYFGGESRFKVQIENDNSKREYAKKMKIPLLEISYEIKDENIIQLLRNTMENIAKESV